LVFRAAFDGPLACAASDRPPADCIDGWTNGARSLLEAEDPVFVRSLLGYYVDLLRGDPAKIARLCSS
jgi:hypothetical protein